VAVLEADATAGPGMAPISAGENQLEKIKGQKMNFTTDPWFHRDFLELLAKRLQPKLYVELGIASCECIQRVAHHCGRAIGVDVKAPDFVMGFEYFQGSSADFAATTLRTLKDIELAFIDADHRHAASLQDFEWLLPHMATDGLVVLHDTYPENQKWLADDHCSDSYRTADVIYRRGRDYGVEIVTLPTPPGLSIVRKRLSQVAWLRSPP
jgi:Methyltransferase domain